MGLERPDNNKKVLESPVVPLSQAELQLQVNTILYDFTESDDYVNEASRRLLSLITQHTDALLDTVEQKVLDLRELPMGVDGICMRIVQAEQRTTLAQLRSSNNKGKEG